MVIKENVMKGMVLMPVRVEHVGDVLSLQERLESEAVAVNAVGAVGPVAERSRAELLRRIFEDCARSTQRILLELAKRGGDWIYGHELAKVASPKGKSINTSPYMKSLGVADNRHRRVGEEPVIKAQRGRDRLFQFKMEKSDAEIVRGFGS
jgi:hypothetical protein